MLKDITLGQYFPGNSLLHRLDPRVKLVLLVMYIVTLFLCKFVFSYAIMLLFLAACVAISLLSPKIILRGMKPLIFILLFTAALNIFYTPGVTLAEWWIFRITREGLWNAGFMALRLFMLITGTFLLTYTTSPIMLTDALARLMSPLAKIRVPVHELSMMMTIALRFIPTLIEETDKIMNAQKARGADFETGNLMRRARALLPLLVPLFVSAFRRADELAVAMESRCYHGGEGRTRMKQLRMEARDYLSFLFCAVLFAGVITLGVFGL